MSTFKIPYPLVEIIWDDAASNSEAWVDLADIIGPERVNTTGFLVKENEGSLTIAASVSTQEEFINSVGNTMTIPKGMIFSRRELKVTNASSKLRHKVHPKSSAKEVHREQSEGGPVLKQDG